MSKEEKRQDLATAPSLRKSIEFALRSEVFSEGSWPEEKWWTVFASSELNSWIEEALVTNPSLIAVERWIDQAKQQSLAVRSKLFPTLYFNADDDIAYFSKNSLTHALNPALPLYGYEVTLALAFNYEFDFWNKNRNMFRAAVGELKSRQAEFEQAKLILATSLAQAYFALATTQKKKELYEELALVKKTRLTLQKHLEKSDLLSRFPSLLSEEEVQEVEETVASMKNEIAIQSHLIQILKGKGPDDEHIYELPLPLPPKTIPIPSDLSINLLARRPDLMAQIWKAESLAAEVGAARAEYFPDINLAAFAGLVSLAFNTLFQSSSATWQADPALSLPIFTAGRIKANIQAKKADFDKAIFEYNNLLLTSAQEVADLVSYVTTVYKQKTMQEEVVKKAEQRLNLTSLRVEGGLDSRFDMLNFQEEIIDKKIKDLDLLYQQYAFVIKLIKSLGGGYLSPHLPIAKEES